MSCISEKNVDNTLELCPTSKDMKTVENSLLVSTYLPIQGTANDVGIVSHAQGKYTIGERGVLHSGNVKTFPNARRRQTRSMSTRSLKMPENNIAALAGRWSCLKEIALSHIP